MLSFNKNQCYHSERFIRNSETLPRLSLHGRLCSHCLRHMLLSRAELT